MKNLLFRPALSAEIAALLSDENLGGVRPLKGLPDSIEIKNYQHLVGLNSNIKLLIVSENNIDLGLVCLINNPLMPSLICNLLAFKPAITKADILNAVIPIMRELKVNTLHLLSETDILSLENFHVFLMEKIELHKFSKFNIFKEFLLNEHPARQQVYVYALELHQELRLVI